MYEELVERLRNAAHWADKGLVIDPSIHYEAANAIEDLTNKIMQAENDSGLYDELPMMVLSNVKEPPKDGE